MAGASIPAIMPRGAGHQFVLYADCCSGIPGTGHEATFAAVNAALARLDPQPEFILFPGDEVLGLTADEAALRAQWRHWREVEMAWLDSAMPLYHATANHTVYDGMSARVFGEVLDAQPGPTLAREGLNHAIRQGDLLIAVLDTVNLSLGGEGHIDVAWLERTLRAHGDARHKLVVGHYPAHAANGFTGPCQRQIEPGEAQAMWDLLVEHGVTAYLCSHMLAFDVQVHDGIPQIMSAGAGTGGLMPPDSEYHHLVQMALDEGGLRYQVIDSEGEVRESLAWPPTQLETWRPVDMLDGMPSDRPTAFRFSGTSAAEAGPPQTLASAWNTGPDLAPLWIGLTGRNQRLTVVIRPYATNSPHTWFGPAIAPGETFDIRLILHPGMGPGGVLARLDETQPWSSLIAASSWGTERLPATSGWSLGQGKAGPDDMPFLGTGLRTAACPLL